MPALRVQIPQVEATSMLAGTAIGDRVPPRWCVNVNIIEYYKYIYSKYCIVLRGADVYFDILVFANPF